MGVPGLWDILRPAGQTRSLTHLAVVDGFEANPDGVRGFRVGVDASIWFYHATYGREGENPELRTMFFRCTRLMSAPFLPLFVFDGPKRPEIKRGKRISGKNHWMVQGMCEIINAFGFEWRIAPGEAEAELAYFNRTGVIDAVLSDDVDTFLFGATMVVRNASINLTGNRAHSLKNSSGKDDGNHVATYKAADISDHPDIGLTQGGMILIGIMRGGDYHQAGLTGCGGTIAHGLARCGFGDTLLTAARTLPRASLPAFLSAWRTELREELRTNSRGFIGRKNPTLAKSIPEDFPDIDVLLSYTHPATSEGSKSKGTPIDWGKEPDLGKIAGLCEMYFEWGLKDIIIKRFRTVLWPSAVLRILRRSVLLADKKSMRRSATVRGAPPSTPEKNTRGPLKHVGTPSSMISKHFSRLQMGSPTKRATRSDSEDDEDDEDALIMRIHSSRTHASTDGILEYRLEVAPAQLVRLCEAGVKGLRTALPPELSDEDEDDEDEDGTKRKGKTKKPPPDPLSSLRIWLPACLVRMVEPEMVDEFEGIQAMRQAKKAGKASGSKTSTASGSKSRAKKGTSAVSRIVEEEESELPVPKKPPKAKVAKEAASELSVPKAKSVATKASKKPIFSDGESSSEPGKVARAAVTVAPVKKTIRKSKATSNANASSGSRVADKEPTATVMGRKTVSDFCNASKGVSNPKPQAGPSTVRSHRPPSPPPRKQKPTFVEVSDSSGDEPAGSTLAARLSSQRSTATTSSNASRSRGASTASLSVLSALDSDALSHTRKHSSPPASPPKPRPAPQPFPMSFHKVSTSSDLDDPFGHTTKPRRPVQKTRPRSPPSSNTSPTLAPLHKSPRTSPHHSSPHSLGTSDSDEEGMYTRRAPSPSPMRPRVQPALASLRASPKRASKDTSVIEISSDSDSSPVKLAPLLRARARAPGALKPATKMDALQPTSSQPKPSTQTKISQSRFLNNDPEDIIDLT